MPPLIFSVRWTSLQVHTQGIENFWSFLKRTLRGTYVAVEPFHLDHYLDEQVFRYNNRATKDNKITDADRFALVMSQVAGKRLTYAQLTGQKSQNAHNSEALPQIATKPSATAAQHGLEEARGSIAQNGSLSALAMMRSSRSDAPRITMPGVASHPSKLSRAFPELAHEGPAQRVQRSKATFGRNLFKPSCTFFN